MGFTRSSVLQVLPESDRRISPTKAVYYEPLSFATEWKLVLVSCYPCVTLLRELCETLVLSGSREISRNTKFRCLNYTEKDHRSYGNIFARLWFASWCFLAIFSDVGNILSRGILLYLAELRNIWHVCRNSRMNARHERIVLELDGC